MVSNNGNSWEITAQLLKDLENNTTFDAIRFTNADGVNLASSGATNDSSDREYFARGMRGESGLEAVKESRITGKPMMVFYAPVYREGTVAGMFLGLYPVAKSYLERLSKPVLEWGGKLLFFLLALSVGRSALHLLLFPELPAVLVYLGGSAVFLAYDFGLSQMAVRLNKF